MGYATRVPCATTRAVAALVRVWPRNSALYAPLQAPGMAPYGGWGQGGSPEQAAGESIFPRQFRGWPPGWLRCGL